MKIKKKTKSILAELFDNSENHGLNVVEARAEHVFASIFNFIDMINDLDLDAEKKEELQKRLVLAIRHKDSRKFMRAISHLKNKEPV
jgi:hypothetical protein